MTKSTVSSEFLETMAGVKRFWAKRGKTLKEVEEECYQERQERMKRAELRRVNKQRKRKRK